MRAVLRVEVREQLSGVGSFLPSCGSQAQTRPDMGTSISTPRPRQHSFERNGKGDNRTKFQNTLQEELTPREQRGTVTVTGQDRSTCVSPWGTAGQ